MRICIFAIVVSIATLVAGCTKEDEGSKNKAPEAPVFDFTTRTKSTLKVQYDVPTGYRVYFEVYGQNPEELDADGQVVKKELSPIDAGFTDENGLYLHSISVPSTVSQIYIYSPYAGVPRVLTAKVVENGTSEAGYPNATSQSASAATRADDDYKKAPYNTISGGNLKRLGYWLNDREGYILNGKNYRLYGRPDYVISDKITVSADILNLINQTLPEGGRVDPNLIKNGDIHVTERANVFVHLIDEQTAANSTLAYYCYDTQNPPKSTNDIKDIIIAFPNSKVLKYHDFAPRGNNGAVERGEGVTLHYWKNGQDMGDEFPGGTSIGWVIYNESYSGPSSSDNNPLNAARTHFYGAQNLNSDNRGHVALFRSGDKVIFGFEDWKGDYDYNDVVFYAKSNPIQAITPEVPEVKPEEPSDDKVAAKVTYRGILAFEDRWPYRADFDMNDVVISYESTVGYNNKNEVLETTDKYTVLHSGAFVNNSFAYQLDVRRSEVEVDIVSSLGGNGGAYLDPALDRATVRLANRVLDYANNQDATFEVQAKYTGRRLSKDDFTKPPYNPFITTTNSDTEVHLTNMRPTDMLDKTLLGSGDDKSEPNRNLYYITYGENGIQMPFAIDLQFESTEDMAKFIIPEELQSVDTFYPGFLGWIQSNGSQNKDWYLKPRK